MDAMESGFLVLDFGSQYVWLIVRRFRELGYPSEALRFDEPLEAIRQKNPLGIVISGGPASVLDKGAPSRPVQELQDIAPVLAVCYGMQLAAHQKGGALLRSKDRTYGQNVIFWERPLVLPSAALEGKSPEKPAQKGRGESPPAAAPAGQKTPGSKKQENSRSGKAAKAEKISQKVWMSHGDSVKTLPPGAELLARDSRGLTAAFAMGARLWAFQFHPEVSHTEGGGRLLKAFAEDLCRAPAGRRQPRNIINSLIQKIREQAPDGEKVFCALSGGVDSTVAAALLSRALGPENIRCVFVDTGLLRKGEYEEVMDICRSLNFNVKGLREGERFLSGLKGVSDPEAKRKIIGRVFIEIFEREAAGCGLLAQGTLYPDVIESLSPKGSGAVIKSHHNVGGLPKNMRLKLVEPLRDLFKDEVREIGAALGISRKILGRHPFPGPGLAVRCPGPVQKESLDILREADAIFIEELKSHGLYDKVWQAFCVLLPVQSVGVQGDSRSYDRAIALRAVSSEDGMTADWSAFPAAFLRRVSRRIVNGVQGINRVVYDITSKPPGTIEWE